MIRLEGVSVRHGSSVLLDGVTLQMGAETVALVGPSGSGKSTLLRVILGLEIPTEGTVSVAGRVASENGLELIAAEERRVAMVFQDLALWPHLDIYGNLELALKAQQVPAPVRRERIKALLAAVDMSDKSDRRPHQLSGGERQRAAIARALVLDPVALLLDEPLTSLDVVTKHEILTLLSRLFSERPLPVLYVAHDAREVVQLVRRVIVLENGRISQDGSLADLRRAPATPFVSAFLRALD